jgi:hypothetical protein
VKRETDFVLKIEQEFFGKGMDREGIDIRLKMKQQGQGF